MKEGEKMEVKVELPKKVTAPVNKGEKIGSVTYKLDGIEYMREDILCKNDISSIDYKFCFEKVVKGYFIGYK